MDHELNISKMNENELIIKQAREGVESGKITTEVFSEIKSKHGNHKRFTKKEYLNLPIFEDSELEDGIYRKKDDKIIDNWCCLYNINNKYASVSIHGSDCSDFLQGPLMETDIKMEIGEII